MAAHEPREIPRAATSLDAARFDAVVLGTGPAGLAATEALAREGLRVAAVSPAPSRIWPNFYGLWIDEAEAVAIEPWLAERWERAELRLGAGSLFVLERGYARIDNFALFQALAGAAEGEGAAFVQGSARTLVEGDGSTSVLLEDGRRLGAWVVLDATGHGGLVPRPPARIGQIAYGVVMRPRRCPFDAATPILMDYSDVPGLDPRAPTFLYALPLRDGSFLFEETSLARAPALDLPTVRAHLERRLAHLGVDGDVIAEERSFIPLTPPLPSRSAPLIPLGAAAALVNPASGYLIPAALRQARQVARLVAAARREGRPPREAAEMAHDATWPPDRRLARELRVFGIDVLSRLDLEGTRAFFRALFSSSPHGWRSFLSHDASPGTLAAVMGETFRALPLGLQIRAAAGLARHPELAVHLIRSGTAKHAVAPRRSHGRRTSPHAGTR